MFLSFRHIYRVNPKNKSVQDERKSLEWEQSFIEICLIKVKEKVAGKGNCEGERKVVDVTLPHG